jgi:beta-lactamase regulating signal transducer with metallopeptidase domain
MSSELLRQLLALTLASSVGIITALALRRVVRRAGGARASYSLWLLVPIAMLSVHLPHVRATSSRAVTIALPATTSALTHAVERSFDSLGAVASTPIDATLWTVVAWGVGAMIFALYLAGLQRAFVKSLGTVSGLRCVRRAQRSVGCPALVGVLRPKVILPADFRVRYTRLERLLVLAHERTHLRRGDAGWNALVALMRCIFWFNPLMHVAARYFRFDQELACDAAVLAARRGSRRPYATAMLKTQLTEGALPIGCHWRSAQDLKERLRMVSRRAPSRRRRLLGGVLTSLTAVVVAYTVWAAEPVAGATAPPATGALGGVRSVMGWTAASAGWLSSPDQHPDQPVIIVMHHAQLFLAAGAASSIVADTVRTTVLSDPQGRLQTTTLEGKVRLTFASPPYEGAGPQTIIVATNRAVLVGHPDGGASVVQVDEATMQTVLPAQFLYGTPQTIPQFVTPNSITPNFKDADISQVAAAVGLATHRTIIIDPRVHAQLNMLSSTPVTRQGFYQAFVDILRTGGWVALPLGPASNAIRIVPANGP